MTNILKTALAASIIWTWANALLIDTNELSKKCEKVILPFEYEWEIINEIVELSSDGATIIWDLIVEVKWNIIRVYTPYSDLIDERWKLVYNWAWVCSLWKIIKD